MAETIPAGGWETAAVESEKSTRLTQPTVEGREAAEGEKIKYPGGLRLALIVVGISLAVFISALDENIVATAIPRITDAFDSFDDVGWYGSAYLLPFAALQLAWGKVYTLFPIKWAFIAGVVIFETGSLVAGLAQSSNALIAGRAISGVGGSGFVSGLFILVAHTVPLRLRPLFTTLAAVLYGVAAAAGPLLGGIFTSKATWRWCFFVNIPCGVVAAVVVALALRGNAISESTEKKSHTFMSKMRQFDFLGTATFAASVSCLLVALQLGGSRYSWCNGRVIGLLVACGVSMVAFVAIQRKLGKRATVPGRLIRERTVICCTVYVFCLSGALEQLAYFLPVWFQVAQGSSPLGSGIQTLGLVIAFVVGGIISGILVTVFGYYNPFMISGSALYAVGAGLCTILAPTSIKGEAIGFQVIAGLGAGFGLDQSQIAVQAVSALEDIPIRTAMVVAAQVLGSAVCLSVGNSILDQSLVRLVREKLPHVLIDEVLDCGATAFVETLSAADRVTGHLIYSMAASHTWYFGAALAATACVFSFGVAWKSVKEEESSAR